MSTTFEVFPGTAHLPTFSQVLDLSAAYLGEFLESIGLHRNPAVRAEIWKGPNRIVVPDQHRVFTWAHDEYAWCTMANVDGGCDGYVAVVDDIRREAWVEDITVGAARCADFADEIRNSMEIGYYWSLRRSAGQPALISLYYGLLAAAVAELTNGFIYSDDGAWDFRDFPMRPETLRTVYFRPEHTCDTDRADWVQRHLLALPKELDERNPK